MSFQQELNIDSVNYDLKYAYFHKTVKTFKICQTQMFARFAPNDYEKNDKIIPKYFQ